MMMDYSHQISYVRQFLFLGKVGFTLSSRFFKGKTDSKEDAAAANRAMEFYVILNLYALL